MKPICDYYFDRETALCDISPEDDEADHNYRQKRNRTIDELTDYNARKWTNFTKSQLKRIKHMFNTAAPDYAYPGPNDCWTFPLIKL